MCGERPRLRRKKTFVFTLSSGELHHCFGFQIVNKKDRRLFLIEVPEELGFLSPLFLLQETPSSIIHSHRSTMTLTAPPKRSKEAFEMGEEC